MTVSFEIPQYLEESLQIARADLSAEAKEAFLVTLYRQQRISHLVLSEALGLDRFQTEEVLQKHHVIEDMGTLADYLSDAQSLADLRTAPGT